MEYLFTGGGRRAATGLVALALGSVVTIAGIPGPAGASGGSGDDHGWEPESHYTEVDRCREALGDQEEYTVAADTGDDVPDDGRYRDDHTGYEFDIDITERDGRAFLDFASNQPVDRLYIDSGRGCLVYEFPEGIHEADDLPAPDDSISQVGFGCRRRGHDSPTTSAPEAPPPTEPSSPEEPSEPTVPETPTTMPDEQPTTTVTTPEAAAVTTTTSTTAPAGESLPVTGSNTGLTLAVGAGLLVAGAALVAAARLRRSREAEL